VKNYFNYFTEVEEHFVRKRGKNLLVSPLDWCLIEVWKQDGVPLQIALRGIDRSFETALKRHKKPPTTLFYCHPAVMEAFQEYREAMLGARPEEGESPGSSESSEQGATEVRDHLDRLIARLQDSEQAGVARVLARLSELRAEVTGRPDIDPGELERELLDIQSVLTDSFETQVAPARLSEIKAEVKDETKIYKKHLSKEMYDRLRKRYLQRKLLAEYGLPEFTLLQ